MFGWYSNRIPTIEDLTQRLKEHFIPEILKPKVLSIIAEMSEKGYKTGRLIADVKVRFISSDEKKVGDNLWLTHPTYSYKNTVFEGLIGEFSEYTETFNAGNGRVTAGSFYSEYYEIVKIGEPIWVTNS